VGVGGENDMNYLYKIRWDNPNARWLVFEGTEEDGFEEVASFLRPDDAELWVLEKEADQKRG
jgi:hypothetical protein